MTSKSHPRDYTLKDLKAVAVLLGFDNQYITDMHLTTDYIDVTYADPENLGPDEYLALSTHRHHITRTDTQN